MSAAILLPVYCPDGGFPCFVRELRRRWDGIIAVVDDGNGENTAALFAELERECGIVLIRHAVNQGKGRALKSAFNQLLLRENALTGVVTADADGQHKVEDVLQCLKTLEAHPEALVLGVRDFSAHHVPWRSRFGNRLTGMVFRWLAGCRVSDTQTGLRGIPADFMKRLLRCPGERFEFETTMLLEAKAQKIPFVEVPIATVYQPGNPSSHFHPVADSLRIYRIIFWYVCWQVASCAFSGILSAVVDLGCFAVLYRIFSFLEREQWHLLFAVIPARLISLGFNYLVNKYLVFGTTATRRHPDRVAFPHYLLLCAGIMGASWGMTYAGKGLLPEIPAVAIKAVVDTLLFFISFQVQKSVIFR